MTMRFQKNPARDARLTAAFHWMLRTVQPPPRPVDGVRIPAALLRARPIDWPQWEGWPRVRMDVRLLRARRTP